jgi:hypothetical protein
MLFTFHFNTASRNSGGHPRGPCDMIKINVHGAEFSDKLVIPLDKSKDKLILFEYTKEHIAIGYQGGPYSIDNPFVIKVEVVNIQNDTFSISMHSQEGGCGGCFLNDDPNKGWGVDTNTRDYSREYPRNPK